MLKYIDDWLILAQSREISVRHRDVVLGHIQSLGLRHNMEKSVLLPAQRTMFLGVVLDSAMMRAQLSSVHIKPILAIVSRMKLGHTITVKQFQECWGSWQMHPT